MQQRVALLSESEFFPTVINKDDIGSAQFVKGTETEHPEKTKN